MTLFKELQAVWYKKLKQDGFVDIEYENGDLTKGPLKYENFPNGDLFANRAEAETYYRVIGIYINHHKCIHKEILQHFIFTGNMTAAVKLAKSKVNPQIVSNYVTRNFPKMLEFFNEYNRTE